MVSNYDINSNPDLVKHMLEQYKASEEQMKKIQTAYYRLLNRSY